jgi:hypothetical protein
MSKLALKYIIEASYELNFIAKTEWVNSFLNLNIQVVSESDCSVIKYDDAYTGEDLDILDNLIILHPYYSSIYFSPNYPCRDNQSIKNNVNYFNERISSQFANDPFNDILLSGLNGSIAQVDTSTMSAFYTQLLETLQQHGAELWGQFNRVNSNMGNDVSLSAMFLMMFLTNIGGLKIYGGVTESKFYYEEFGIRGVYNANMPNTWKNIRIKGVGTTQQLYNVVNNLFYP